MELATGRARQGVRYAVEDSPTQRISSWLEPQKILLDIELRHRWHALEWAAATIARMHRLDPAPILRALRRRELVGSTALGCGVAIPHARIDGIERPLTLFVRPRWAIDFAAPDGKPVSSILVIMVPSDGDTDDHLQLLALVAQSFSDPAFRSRIAGSNDIANVRCAFAECAQRIAQPPFLGRAPS